MPVPESEEGLAKLFRDLGARDPEGWARSQVTEGIPQLLRFLFLKHAWDSVISEGSNKWIEQAIESSRHHPQAPYAGLGLALATCRSKGVSDEDLTEIARCLQAEMLFSIAYLLNGPPYEPGPLEDVAWGLFQTDVDGNAVGRQISGLHESVLELEPSGREMRPRSAV